MRDEQEESGKWSYTYMRTIFLKALEIHDAREQQAFLDRACTTNIALRGQIQELLRANVAAGTFLGNARRADPAEEG